MLTGQNWLIRFRRMFGLFAFFYICLHFLVYSGLDQRFDLTAIGEDILKRPYITLGITGLVLLIPLALLASAGVESLRRGAANAWYWFSITGFTFFVIVAWFYWSGLELGLPARLHAHLHRLQPGHEPGFRLLPFTLAALYTAGWLSILANARRSPDRPVLMWAAGVTTIWALLAILFIAWVDTGKSYRSMVGSLQQTLPRKYQCISSRGLGEGQRAMLHYFGGIITQREEVAARRRNCDLILVQGHPRQETPPRGTWKKIWEGGRPGDKDERYRLYQRR
jgi:DMSO/TMAO reductase YedYZ heme-binding membrane subunit